MTDTCLAAPADGGFVGTATAFIDCHAGLLGSGAYQALGAPGSTLSIVLTGSLTIFIALIGYNLLLGQGPTLRSGTLAMAKIGMIFTLSTSWPAYRTLVYDLVTEGPGEIVGDIGQPIGVSGDQGRLVERLDLVDSALVQLSILGPGDPIWAAPGTRVAAPPFAGFSAFALGTSRIVFLLAAVGGQGIVKVTIGLLLALGPFFIAFLMFDATRGVFVGWVRVLAGAAIGAIGVSIVLGLELAMMEPWLLSLLSRRQAGEALPSMPTELAVITILFALLVFAAIGASARMAAAFRWPAMPTLPGLQESSGTTRNSINVPASAAARSGQREERTRAAEIAETMTRNTYRERATPAGERLQVMRAAELNGASAGRQSGAAHVQANNGRSSVRRMASRVSTSAQKRDRRA
jgi:type IV secretion system protein VirB6